MPRVVAVILSPYGKQQDCRDANTVITKSLNQSQEPSTSSFLTLVEKINLYLTQVTVSQEFQYFNS